MSDMNELDVKEVLPTISAGEILKSAREAKKLDIDDICSFLRLSPRQVTALENNDYSALPESTITRGFIRNYARMLELDAEPLLEAYRSHTVSDQTRPISIQSANIQIYSNDKRPWLIYIFASVLIVLLVTAWVVYVDYIPKPASKSVYIPSETELEATDAGGGVPSSGLQQSLPMPVESVPFDSAVPLELPANAEMPDTNSSSPGGAGAESSEPDGQSVIVPDDGQAVIKLKSNERSWVQITDRNNKRIFDKAIVANVEETVHGEPPLQVVVGNAPSTTLVFNNQIVDLAPLTKGSVARLKLE